MDEIRNVAELNNAIQLLEIEQEVKWKSLQNKSFVAFESLKPINLINSTLKEISSSPYLLDNIIGSAMGVASGFISRKIVVGTSSNLFRKLSGAVLQFGVTNLVAHNPEVIMKLGRFIVQYIAAKKSKNSDRQ